MAENIIFSGNAAQPGAGSAGINTQVAGAPTTVSAAAGATGGIAPGHLIEADVDEQLFQFQSEDTALMSLMLRARKVHVNSPEVEHFMIDEQRSTLTVATAVAKNTAMQFVLPLAATDQNIAREYHTLLVKGVNGYTSDGQEATPGKDLMLYVTGRDTATNNPVVRAINGPKNNRNDLYCTTPAIPAGAKVKLLANAMYETQKEVDPDLIVPQPETVYLQKRGMNQVVSDYFEAQKKHIPFAQSVIAEQAILNFKRAGNRTLWGGRKGKIAVTVPKMGEQTVYFTEGLRWQFKREVQSDGSWSIDKLIALAKMFYTGEDAPKNAILLAGKNLLESIQRIDFSKHPEVQMIATQNPIGWAVTRIHTVFGDIDIKREPTLDTLGWCNSGALIGDDRLVHYTYSSEHEFSDRVDGEEATRNGIVVWDGIALKGTCHLWIDGEGGEANRNSVNIKIWEDTKAPAAADLHDGDVYYLTNTVTAINAAAVNGTMWQWKDEAWTEYSGNYYATNE